ncbi:hypothetical protein EVAR_93553_1 [Eumeta japonica]|uniref:Uncharacterized protein n=1 Tax=Eumeta variegata TaxID=151549 RepID=A0A4C1UR36_EUMVA|nr:hypothetical protein EVAR_93553_1 [Eumeta japonica]
MWVALTSEYPYTRDSRGVTIALPIPWRKGWADEEEKWATETFTDWTKNNSGNCYFTSVLCVARHYTYRHLLILRLMTAPIYPPGHLAIDNYCFPCESGADH